MQNGHPVTENIQMNIQLINFNILLGLSLTSIYTNDIKKINNNTNIFFSTSDKLDVIVFGLRPHTITANIVVGLDEYLLNSTRSSQDLNLTIICCSSSPFCKPFA